MELYYKDLISKDSSLEQLVDNMMLVVQGAEEYAEATGTSHGAERRKELARRLAQLKEGCRKVKAQTKATALAFDKVLHQYPYSSTGFAFAGGLLLGILIIRSSSDDPHHEHGKGGGCCGGANKNCCKR